MCYTNKFDFDFDHYLLMFWVFFSNFLSLLLNVVSLLSGGWKGVARIMFACQDSIVIITVIAILISIIFLITHLIALLASRLFVCHFQCQLLFPLLLLAPAQIQRYGDMFNLEQGSATRGSRALLSAHTKSDKIAFGRSGCSHRIACSRSWVLTTKATLAIKATERAGLSKSRHI